MTRRGFTLIELMIAMIVSAIVGIALVRLTVGEARFMSKQEAWRSARSVSRSGINRLVSDLRVVENGSQAALGGVIAAAAGGQDFTIRVPYAFGVVCSSVLTTTTVSLLPVDSAMFNAPGYSGFAWRNSAGVYTYIANTTAPGVPGTPGNCTAAVPLPVTILGSINGSPAGQTANLTSGAALAPPPPVASTIVFLYRRVRYEFKASVAVPGRNGLWRTLLDGGGGATEEIAAPFDNSARVNFYVLNNAVAQAAVPANLYDIRGFELVLNGMSERAPEGTTATPVANVTTSVFFENRPD
jgi:prepilin-type N-terminal cleavage/methylation domain-containing protein